ncbi:DUF262 domain-containing protein [Shewanella sp.]|uniref:DUF262 domain-containing protein n=1 Tax=Shewanella sp. TaxID=50422 RepID=UPI00258C9C78|nr:DUF262 domain-containing protein [Shewanella sp.]MCJ8305110.1 DUF262 domain-containing protein [Shewanella sp.]
MSNNSSVQPEVLFVDDILTDIENGNYKVPAFQRGYVWDHHQVIELFESIFLGYPIGSVLLWGTNIKMREHDAFNAPKKSLSGKHSYSYVVDGQQRLTTIYHCLTESAGKDSIWDVYADLKTGTFLHLDKGESPKAHYFSLKKIRSTSAFLKECKRLLESPESDELIERAEALSNTVRKYKLSVINMVGGGIEEAVEIFTRLNRTGLDILPFDVINALNYVDKGPNPFLSLRDDMGLLVLENGLFDFEKDGDIFQSQVYLKIVRISSNFQLYGVKDTIPLANHCKSKDFASRAPDMLLALKLTLKFLNEEVRIYKYSDLPYNNLFYFSYIYIFNQLKRGGALNYTELRYHFYCSAISGLPNAGRSPTEKILEFFGQEFNKKRLTKKLLAQYSQDTLSQYIEGVRSGYFSATSAHSKLTYNVISHSYLSSTLSSVDKDNLSYPPLNLSANSLYKGRLGNKKFFVKNYNKGDSDLFGDSAVPIGESDIQHREKAISQLVEDFFKLKIKITY